MKKFTGLVVAVTLVVSSAQPQVPAPVLGPAEAYDAAVLRIWGQVQSVGYVVDWCRKNVSSAKGPVQKAYQEWNTRFGPLIADINERSDQIMNRSGALTAAEFAEKKAEMTKRGAAKYAAGIADEPADQLREECKALPQYFTTSNFDLETRFASELAIIRSQPRAKPVSPH